MFKSFAYTVLLKGLQIITSGGFIDSVKAVVLSLITSNADGDTKRKVALETLKDMGYNFGSNILNMAIEIVLVIVRDKADEYTKKASDSIKKVQEDVQKKLEAVSSK